MPEPQDKTYVEYGPIQQSVIDIMNGRVQPKPLPELHAAPPDPDEVFLEWLLGEGTGDWKTDMLLGLAGPASGPAIEMMGGKSGVVDYIPGGSVAKGAILGIAGKAMAKSATKKSVEEIAEIVAKKPSWMKMDAWLKKNGIDPDAAGKGTVMREAVEEAVIPGSKNREWIRNNWKSEEHIIPEYKTLLPANANETDRRALFVADSLAKHVLKNLEFYPNNWHNGTVNDIRHKATNYEKLYHDLGKEYNKNYITGNLFGTRNVDINALPDGRFFINDANGENLYDMLFRERVNKEIEKQRRKGRL